jgi:hypothetical protein
MVDKMSLLMDIGMAIDMVMRMSIVMDIGWSWLMEEW